MLIIKIFRATFSWLFDGNMFAINSPDAAWIVPPSFKFICNLPPLVGSFWCLETKEKNMPINYFCKIDCFRVIFRILFRVMLRSSFKGSNVCSEVQMFSSQVHKISNQMRTSDQGQLRLVNF